MAHIRQRSNQGLQVSNPDPIAGGTEINARPQQPTHDSLAKPIPSSSQVGDSIEAYLKSFLGPPSDPESDHGLTLLLSLTLGITIFQHAGNSLKWTKTPLTASSRAGILSMTLKDAALLLPVLALETMPGDVESWAGDIESEMAKAEATVLRQSRGVAVVRMGSEIECYWSTGAVRLVLPSPRYPNQVARTVDTIYEHSSGSMLLPNEGERAWENVMWRMRWGYLATLNRVKGQSLRWGIDWEGCRGASDVILDRGFESVTGLQAPISPLPSTNRWSEPIIRSHTIPIEAQGVQEEPSAWTFCIWGSEEREDGPSQETDETNSAQGPNDNIGVEIGQENGLRGEENPESDIVPPARDPPTTVGRSREIAEIHGVGFVLAMEEFRRENPASHLYLQRSDRNPLTQVCLSISGLWFPLDPAWKHAVTEAGEHFFLDEFLYDSEWQDPRIVDMQTRLPGYYERGYDCPHRRVEDFGLADGPWTHFIDVQNGSHFFVNSDTLGWTYKDPRDPVTIGRSQLDVPAVARLRQRASLFNQMRGISDRHYRENEETGPATSSRIEDSSMLSTSSADEEYHEAYDPDRWAFDGSLYSDWFGRSYVPSTEHPVFQQPEFQDFPIMELSSAQIQRLLQDPTNHLGPIAIEVIFPTGFQSAESERVLWRGRSRRVLGLTRWSDIREDLRGRWPHSIYPVFGMEEYESDEELYSDDSSEISSDESYSESRSSGASVYN